MTFSLVARCPDTGMLGVAVSSSSPAVAARCARVRASVGASSSQNVTDPRLGPRLLDLLEAGRTPEQAIAGLVDDERGIEHRQLLAVDSEGRSACFSGERTLGVHAALAEDGVAAAGNLLADAAVPQAMVEGFRAAAGVHLGARLVTALATGLEAGGEAGPVRSAGVLVADLVDWPVVDLRVDWDDAPVGALAQLWALWAPQIESYVTRALDPDAAPAFGVPGNRR